MKKNDCIHCGEDCGKHPVLQDQNRFCCHGCMAVYSILETHKLTDYYELEKTPGIKLKDQYTEHQFAYLDNEDIQKKLFSFSEGTTRKVTLYIPSIHCSSCIWLLENLYILNSGVLHALVNFVNKEVSITFDSEKISLRELVELLASIHYLPIITLDDTTKKEQHSKEAKKLLYKLGIAGFCFANIMLLSLPEYLPGREHLEQNFRNFFGFLNIALALPVLLYSGWDYIASAYKSVRHGIVNINLPIALGIITLFLHSCYVIILHGEAGYMDSLAGLVFFLLIGKWYQSKTYEALSFERNYKSYFPIAVTRLEGKKEVSVELDKLQQGDRILIRNRELIPADAILLKGQASIDYSFVSGESTPVVKTEGEFIFAGGKQVGDSIELMVEKTVKQSYLTQLWNETDHNELQNKTRLHSIVDVVSKYFTLFIIAIAVVAAGIWLLIDPTISVRVFASVLIVACPCALALSIPFTFGNGQRVLGRKGFYLKSADVIELLTKIDTLVFDKTGTLTLNNDAEIKFVGEELNEQEEAMIQAVVRNSGHPLSQIIYKNYGHDPLEVEDYEEHIGKGMQAYVKNTQVHIGSGQFVLGKTNIEAHSTRVYVSFDKNPRGYFAIANKYRSGIKELITNLQKDHKLHVLTGDNESEKENLQRYFGTTTHLLFNQKPEQKLSYVQALAEQDQKVLMMGDGLNDAGALQHSYIGVSIADDIYQFSPACDIIMDADAFSHFDSLLKFARSCIKTVRLSFIISLFYNLTGLFFAVQGLLSPVLAAILMPLSSVTVAVFTTLSVNMSARKWK